MKKFMQFKIMSNNDAREVCNLHLSFEFHDEKLIPIRLKNHNGKQTDFNFQMRNFFREYVLSENKAGVVARDDKGIMIGFIIGRIERKYNPYYDMKKVGHLDMIYVTELARGKQIGSELYIILEQWFKENGCEIIQTKFINRNDKAKKFYHKKLFTEVEIIARKKI